MLVNKKFLVLGAFGKSGMSVCKLIRTLGGIVYFFDDRLDSDKEEKLKNLGCRSCFTFKLQREFIKKLSYVIISPSVPLTHKVVKMANDENIEVVSEMEFAAYFLKGRVIAVTGTNGKSTTVNLIHNILKVAHKESYLLGNIGIPLSEKCLDVTSNGYVCLECSSFQLESLKKFKPYISAILNFSIDHLDRHKNLEEYIDAKKKIYLNQKNYEYTILNYDDKEVRKCKSRARKIYFSIKKKTTGAYLKGKYIYYNGEKIISIDEIKIKGMHNVKNVLAAITIVKILGINDYYIKQALMAFSGLRHRLELVGKVNNITYINDSKATNIDSTLTALQVIDRPLVLILGGKDKNENFNNLISKLKKNVKFILVFGENKFKIVNALIKNSFTNYAVLDDLDEVISLSNSLSIYYEVVLFSPASSSLDRFKNFEERGDVFIKKVRELM